MTYAGDVTYMGHVTYTGYVAYMYTGQILTNQQMTGQKGSPDFSMKVQVYGLNFLHQNRVEVLELHNV